MPSRKSILLSQGFECNNWNDNWSFVNHERSLVCFTGWVDLRNDSDGYLVLSHNWERGENGRRKAGYTLAIEYINDYIKLQNYGVCVLRHEAVDPNKARRRIREINPELIYGELVEKSPDFFVRPSR